MSLKWHSVHCTCLEVVPTNSLGMIWSAVWSLDAHKAVTLTFLPYKSLQLVTNFNLEPVHRNRLDIITPLDGSIVGSIPAATKPDIERAIAAASQAHRSGLWGRLPGSKRGAVMRSIAQEVGKSLASTCRHPMEEGIHTTSSDASEDQTLQLREEC